ncbi:calcium-binding protein [Thiorhodococcus fuscus]|uniref:Calcium-binding protein n=1 Tax=Thiorhodococcus fuscus TaxID=527200 RepID=A0ABW4YEK6_9GAMM
MADVYGVIEDINSDEGLTDQTKAFLDDFLKELAGEDRDLNEQQYDPNSDISDDTDKLTVPSGLGDEPIELTAEDLGNTRFVDGRDADGGLKIDLSDEGDNLPEGGRVVLGSDHDDSIISGKSDLFVDLGDGNDFVQTGDGDDQLYMGAGDDSISLGGLGNDFINGGDGDDTLFLTGSKDDWTEIKDGDVTMWVNNSTDQVVVTIGVENNFFADDLDQSQADSEVDPDDLG